MGWITCDKLGIFQELIFHCIQNVPFTQTMSKQRVNYTAYYTVFIHVMDTKEKSTQAVLFVINLVILFSMKRCLLKMQN
jgi:hypothetical protein